MLKLYEFTWRSKTRRGEAKVWAESYLKAQQLVIARVAVAPRGMLEKVVCANMQRKIVPEKATIVEITVHSMLKHG